MQAAMGKMAMMYVEYTHENTQKIHKNVFVAFADDFWMIQCEIHGESQ